MTDPSQQPAAFDPALYGYLQSMQAFGMGAMPGMAGLGAMPGMPGMLTPEQLMMPTLMQQPPATSACWYGSGEEWDLRIPRLSTRRDLSALSNSHCRYWKFGRCARGETCFYKHDIAFLGVDRPGSNGVPLASPIPNPGVVPAAGGMSMAASVFEGLQATAATAAGATSTPSAEGRTAEFLDFNSTSIGNQTNNAVAPGAPAAVIQQRPNGRSPSGERRRRSQGRESERDRDRERRRSRSRGRRSRSRSRGRKSRHR